MLLGFAFFLFLFSWSLGDGAKRGRGVVEAVMSGVFVVLCCVVVNVSIRL